MDVVMKSPIVVYLSTSLAIGVFAGLASMWTWGWFAG
jgi:hypothetical protein